jgi:hypothetical protein
MFERCRYRAVALVLAVLLMAGCATTARTSLDASWIDPQRQGAKFKKVVILTVAHDEFAQQYFQEDLAAALKARGVNAEASERFFRHRSLAEEERFKRAVDESGADALLLARVVGVDTKSGVPPGVLIATNGVPVADAVGVSGAWAQAFAPGHYAATSDFTDMTVIVETLLYDLKTRKAVWSARTHTKNANKGDLKPAVAQFVRVVVATMDRDGLF